MKQFLFLLLVMLQFSTITTFGQMAVNYQTFNGQHLTLYEWEGEKVILLSRQQKLDSNTIKKWVAALDATYQYYEKCTGKTPSVNNPYFINNRTTIADVPETCGAGCGYLGATGIELQNSYFDISYNAIHNDNQFSQEVFYEFGRNFWFYGKQLAYKKDDPVTTGYAVFMRFIVMDAIKVIGAPFGKWSFAEFRSKVERLVDTYTANPSLNWQNTLGAGQGVPGSGLGATDLFASFCFYLCRNYGGTTFAENIWRNVATRPVANSTKDAVNNFFLACCQTANNNLSQLFRTWKWPISNEAVAEAARYPK